MKKIAWVITALNFLLLVVPTALGWPVFYDLLKHSGKLLFLIPYLMGYFLPSIIVWMIVLLFEKNKNS